ncbi:hypothetical protein J2X36_005351 [Methylobacterium sp. BE186]|uniref:hypothetical protein n=1 Tax=Methylobacterium sp. BE186 TaxID=2817715 RepID=UPI00285FF7A8|nr:hypothetical protein [Methylobacterium sp. BE186]MDR7040568.1 hypothetical protein [Methylobacterium sp. BE186]
MSLVPLAQPHLSDLLVLSICAWEIWALGGIDVPGAVMREMVRVTPGENEG